MESYYMHEIIPDLWLGSFMAAVSGKNLQTRGITVILTVMDAPLRDTHRGATYHYIQLADIPMADLLSILPTCITVIEKALTEKQKILVHCAAGVSRSASVVIAYIMWKQKISRDVAFKLVAEKRSIIGPNPGFMQQLLQFEGMMTKFKIPLLAMVPTAPTSSSALAVSVCGDALQARDSSSAAVCTVSPSGTEDGVMVAVLAEPNGNAFTEATDSGSASNGMPAKSSNLGSDYLCRKCRQFLFHSNELRQHYVQPTAHFVAQNKFARQSASEVQSTIVDLAQCSNIDELLNKGRFCTANQLFVDEAHWDGDAGQCLSVDGKIHCPKCKCKIGSYTWVGEPCVCGTWVVPAFHVSQQKCDKVRALPPSVTLVTTQSASEVVINE